MRTWIGKQHRAGRRHLIGARLALCAGLAFAAATAVTGAAPAREARAATMQGESRSAQEGVQTLQDTLARLVGEIQSSVPADAGRRLADLQPAWDALVKADCAWEASFSQGGSVAPLVQANCMRKHLAQRIDRLRLFLCEGRGATGECAASRRYSQRQAPRDAR